MAVVAPSNKTGIPGTGDTLYNSSFTGTSLFADGTAAAPSIAWTSDADGSGTGFYRVGANASGHSCNGTLATYFDSAGPSQGGSQGGYRAGGTATSPDVGMYRGLVANSWQFGGGTSATTTSRVEINKAVTAFTNAAAKATFTVTIPNAAHSASIEVQVIGSLGAGGAIGANEATASNTYTITLCRTSGVATVPAISAAYGAAAANVAGAATVTCTAALSAIAGAVGATQTFTIDVTITRGSGSSDNHTCLCYARLMNANVTGVTIA